MLTTNNQEEDISSALLAGADDYLVKPFRAMELCARIYNVIRHKNKSAAAISERFLSIKDFTFNDHTLEFSHLGKPISRKILYKNFWLTEEKYTSRSLDTHIYRIRTQLELTVEHGWQLHTIYGYGYRLEPIVDIQPNLKGVDSHR